MKKTTSIQEIRKKKSILLYDGLCSLCDASVQFVIQRDSKKHFLFASLQSETAKEFLKSQSTSIRDCESVILITSKKVYTKSSAALKTAQSLDGFWFLMSAFFIIPKPIRDYVYDLIAKRRYRWFGQLEQCRIPTAEEQKIFID